MNDKQYFSIVLELIQSIKVDGRNPQLLRVLADVVDDTVSRLTLASKSEN